MDDLQGLLAQFQPTEEDRKRARQQALMAASLSLLGRPKGAEYQSFGQAGLLGMGLYNNQLAGIPQQRMESLKTYAGLQELLQKQREFALKEQQANRRNKFQDSIYGELDGTQAPAGAAQPAQGGVVGQLVQMGVDPMQIRLAMASSDPEKELLKLAEEARKPLFGAGKVPIVRKGSGFQVSVPEGFNDALANQATAEKTAEEQAKASFDLIPVPMGNGQTQMMTRADAAKLFTQRAPAQPKPYGLRGNFTPQELARIQADANGSNPFPVQYGGSVGTTPNPLDMKRAEGEIQTRNEQNNVIAKGQGEDYLNIVKAEKDATGTIAKYDLMKSYLSKVETGKLAPSVLGLKSVAAYVAPNLAKEWTKDVPYAQASAALSNEIALQLRNPQGGAGMPGALSDRDREFLVSMTANSANDPRAIPMMLDARIAMEKRAQEVGRMARQYRQRNGQLDEGFYEQLRNYSEEHPLFAGVVKDAPTSSGGWSIRRIN